MSKIPSRCASREELSKCHTESHLKNYYDCDLSNLKLNKLACGGFGVDNDSYWNGEITKKAGLIAAGGVTDAGIKVMAEPGLATGNG